MLRLIAGCTYTCGPACCPWCERVIACRFDNLQQFLDIYYVGCEVLITQHDFHDLMAAYLQRAAADNVVRAGVQSDGWWQSASSDMSRVTLHSPCCMPAEIFFDPQSHISRGVSWETMLDGFQSAMQVGVKQ